MHGIWSKVGGCRYTWNAVIHGTYGTFVHTNLGCSSVVKASVCGACAGAGALDLLVLSDKSNKQRSSLFVTLNMDYKDPDIH